MDQGGNNWTLFTPGIWKVLHAVLLSTLHRWLNEGLIAGEQVNPGAPWR